MDRFRIQIEYYWQNSVSTVNLLGLTAAYFIGETARENYIQAGKKEYRCSILHGQEELPFHISENTGNTCLRSNARHSLPMSVCIATC
jgi:hypothetical protein